MPVTRIIDYDDREEWKNYTTFRQPVYWITAENLRPDNATKPRVPFTELYIRNHTS